MRRLNHSILHFTSSFIGIGLCLVCTLTPFLSYKNNLINEVKEFNKSIKEKVTLSNYEELSTFYKDSKNYDVIFFSSTHHFISTSLNANFTSSELYAYKTKLSVVFTYTNPAINNGGGFAYVSYNASSSIYVFCIISFTNTYIMLKNIAIIIPIITFLFYLTYYLIESWIYKKDTKFLKHQIRKLRSISQIDSLVEYDNDIENLANILKDTRKKLEIELKNNFISENKLEFILDSIDQGIIVLDPEFKIIMSNKRGRDIFRLANKNSLIENLDDNFKDVIVNIKVTLKTHRAMVFNKEINGLVYEINLNYIKSAFDNTNEEVISLLIFDVTEKYNSEKMKRDFFANAAHELKSPLTSILGFQELIQEGLLTSEAELKNANLKTLKEGERMKKLIMEMLELSALENNNLRQIVKIDVAEEIDNILAMLENQIRDKNIEIIKYYKKIIIKMNIDDFYNLFKNLIENAIRYNNNNGKIYITLDSINRCISIKDTGIGLSDEDKQRIFERFYRVDKARSRENGGTGLGLSIVKYICNYYEFKIQVNSELNKGSEFIVKY